MIKASLVVHPFYNNNQIFNLKDTKVNRDNCLYSFYLLKETLLKEGILLATSDIHKPKESDIVIFNEAPDIIESHHDPLKSYLLLFETDVIRPQNWKLNNHKEFKKVFTWNDDFTKSSNYIKINFSHLFPKKIQRIPFLNRKTCTLIAGNKKVQHPLELYSERLKTIHWFEKNHPNDFEYYGIGWNDISIKNNFINKILRKSGISKFLPIKSSPCYKGTVESKIDVLKNYKFSICYENAKNIPGYITEKIFDSFFAGCIPIYWGAPNISDHIPENCYIDRRQFSTHESLYKHITNISQSEFNERLDSIESFLNSVESKPFSANYFSQTISDHVKK